MFPTNAMSDIVRVQECLSNELLFLCCDSDFLLRLRNWIGMFHDKDSFDAYRVGCQTSLTFILGGRSIRLCLHYVR